MAKRVSRKLGGAGKAFNRLKSTGQVAGVYHEDKPLSTGWHADDTKASDPAKRSLPDVFARAPRWVFTLEACNEILDEFASMDELEYESCFKRFQPRPEVVVETTQVCCVFVHESSSLFDKYSVNSYSLSGHDKDRTVISVFVTAGLVSRYESSDACMSAAKNLCHKLYVARALAADRYFDRRAGERTRAESRGRVHVEEVAVRWDAPTLRYHGRTESPSHVSEPGPPRCLHSVREHLRQYKSGKVAYVRSHTRGDESVPRKTVTRVEGRGSRQ